LQSTTNNVEIIIQHHSQNEALNYSLCIHGNGLVEYNGISGKHVTKISPQDLDRVILEYRNVYFFSFKDSYELSSNQSSSQQEQTSISIRDGDNYKNVKYVEGAYRVPSTLKYLVRTIEKIAKVDELSAMGT
jgi:hypothetical protein